MLLNLSAQMRRQAARSATVQPWRVFSRGISGYDQIYWKFPKPEDELVTFNAVKRESTGRRNTAMLKEERDEIPISIVARESNKKRNKELLVNASVSRREILEVYKTGRFYNQVFNIKVEGEEEPIKAVCATLYREYVFMQPLAVVFTRFYPGKKYKIKVPCWLDNLEDSFALRKGALINKMDDLIPMYWKGGERIPHGMVIDLENSRPPTTFKVDPTNLPDGLSLRIPHHSYTLATLKGSRRYYQQDEPEEEEEKAAATA